MFLVFDWPGPVPDEVDTEYLDGVRRQVRKATQLMTCRAHGKGVTVALVPQPDAHTVGLQVTGCCPEFLRQVKWKLEGG